MSNESGNMQSKKSSPEVDSNENEEDNENESNEKLKSKFENLKENVKEKSQEYISEKVSDFKDHVKEKSQEFISEKVSDIKENLKEESKKFLLKNIKENVSEDTQKLISDNIASVKENINESSKFITDNIPILKKSAPDQKESSEECVKCKCSECSKAEEGDDGIMAQYAGNCTIHGVRYLIEPNRPIAERIFWMASICISIYSCVTYTKMHYNKWEENPIVLSFADKSTPLWKIPFPAITICPEIKSMPSFLNYSDFFNTFQQRNQNISEENMSRFDALSHVCMFHLPTLNRNFTIGKECVERLRKAAPTIEQLMSLCLVPTPGSINCSNYFTEIITDTGVCYTFNIISLIEMFRENEIQNDYIYFNHTKNSTNWTLENGYDDNNNVLLETYPLRVFTTTTRDSVMIYLISHDDDYDYLCSGSIPGFKILFHNPSDYPQFSKNKHHRILLDDQVYFSIIPTITKTSYLLDDYLPNKRQCFYNKERNLRFFKVYTKKNCELECLANFTLSRCGCVKFSMPHAKGEQICGISKINCYRNAEYILAISQQRELLNSDEGEKTDCNCLPSCTSIDYDSEVISYDLNREKLFKFFKYNSISTPPGFRRTVITISFNNMDVITKKRSEFYGQGDFMANWGGILALYLGLSMLSFIEIIYFSTLRLISNQMSKK